MQKKSVSRLIRLFPKRRLLILGLFVTIIYSVITVGFSYLIRMIIDAAVDGDRTVFMFFLQVSIIMIAVNFVLAYLRTRVIGVYTERGVMALREAFGKKVTYMQFESLQERSSGELLSRGTNDLNRVKNFTNNTLPRLIEIPLTGVLALVLLFVFSWQLTLFSLVLVPVLVIGSSLLMKPIAASSKNVQAKLGDVNALTIDMVKGSEAVKAYNLEQTMRHKGDVFIEGSIESGKQLAKRKAILESFSMGFSIVPFVTTFILGGYFVVQGSMTPGSLLAFINLLNFLTMPLSQMAVLVGDAKRDIVSAERIFECLDAEDERLDGERFDVNESAPMVEFKGVSFQYKDAEDVTINKLSLSVKSGQTVAFVGPSGGGKSTVAKLILGYYDTYLGKILLGGYEQKKWSLNALRDHLAMVSQDTYLFPDTVKENIRYGRYAATDEEVYEAAKQANAHDFIEAMPEGYDTMIGEMGSTLSGGQKQRLAIARAILKKAPILLLDEATSALDTESEALIQETFNKISKDKTAIVIAHRLSTVQDADLVYVIDKGKVVESGTHESLLEKGGVYTRLYQKQLIEEVEGTYENENL